MLDNMYSPENGPFPPYIENPSLRLHKTKCDGGSDIAYLNGYIYIINAEDGGSFRVCTADESEPEVLGMLSGLGNMRQLEVSATAAGGRIIVAMTARECGLWLVDVTEPSKPFVCCHYNTVELATGVCFHGKYVFIGCRSFGVEIIDIAKPEAPRHISVIRAGEVQSVYVSNGILYTGSWGERQVNVFDVNDVAAPKYLSKIPLEGRGDGLCVRDGMLYAAFGQHLQSATGNDPEEYGYGRGNGFAIWDVNDPADPKQISVTLFPIRFFAHWDMWDVTLCKNYAVITHTMNGVWIYDIADPKAPKLIDHVGITTDKKLWELFATDEENMKNYPFKLPFDPNKVVYAPIAGVAAADGRLYIAPRFQNLHIASADIICEEAVIERSLSCGDVGYYERCRGDNCEDVKIVPVDGQAHGAAYSGGCIYVACGMEGVVIFDEKLCRIGHFGTDGFAMDVREANGLIFIAAGNAGVIICRPDGAALVEIGRFCDEKSTYAQVVPSENGRFLMVHKDDRYLAFLDISDPTTPKQVMLEYCTPGLIYHRQLSHTGVGGRYYGCFWNGNFTRWYDLSGDEPKFMEYKQGKLGFVEGITGMSEPYKALVTRGSGYCIHDIRNELMYRDAEYTHIEGVEHCFGKPVIMGDKLVLINRLSGNVVICDISDPAAPKLIRKLNFSGHPDIVCAVPQGSVIPLGHQGVALVEI